MDDARRAAVVAEAESWIGTPFHHHAAVKGAGVDCLNLLAEVYRAAGVIERAEIPYYPQDWHLHRDAERFLDGLSRYARKLPWDGRAPAPAQAGDIALFRYGRCFSHGAIVVEWPRLIHANFAARAVCWGDATLSPLAGRPARFFTVL